MPSAVEAVIGRHRALTIGALIVLTLLAWAWLVSGAGMGMQPRVSLWPAVASDPAMSGMAMAGAIEPAMGWPADRLLLTLSMWWVMMVAMMLPSAAPMMLLYARTATHGQASARPDTANFLAGYLIAWGAFSLLATVLQLLLETVDMLAPMLMASQSRWLSAGILISAGLYQISPLKDVCLRHCRSPALFLSQHYRPGQVGALRMGLLHGTYCVGCCWLLMALLFVGGVMNLAWIALLTLMVAAEKLLPFGRLVALAGGLVCMAWGTTILLS